jgi:transcriptional regulator with XRE-family HTH domain
MKQKSLRQLARELEISPAYLSMILSGQRNPNTQLRDKLCSQGLFTSEANIGLGSKHSTTELHPRLATERS